MNKNYQSLTIPQLTWNKNTLTQTYGEVVGEPLEPGFGITLGNALRRVLLGGIEGSAVTGIIISGVNNEFSSVEGVQEDALQISLNTKEIIIKNTTGEPGTMRLRVEGEAEATVADIEADSHLELINTEHIIAHVAKDAVLDVEFFVEPGRGYRTAQWPTDQALQDDSRIYLDAMFAPVRKASYSVEKTRVGKDIDYDKLILHIKTDGTITATEALHYAVSVLRTQLEHFLIDPEIPFNEISDKPANEKEEGASHVTSVAGVPTDLLLKSIDALELSVRAHNCLMNADITRIINLVNMSEDELQNIKNFGRKSFEEVKDALKESGFSLGMNIDESDLKQ
jgi:DNA-directed RNA polymerase subunit alpha